MALPLGLSDALLDGFVGQFYRETDGVRDLLSTLFRDESTGKPLPALPQIVVVGQESSGKSSVLESLAMLPLFPRDERICTRMPIHLKMRRHVSKNDDQRQEQLQPTAPQIKMRLVFADARPPIESQEQFAADQVAPLMRQWMDDIIQRESQDAGVAKGVVDHVLEIHVTSPHVPTLDLVDLPGIVAGRLVGEPHDMMEQTRALVEKYLKMPHTLVLAVIPANERVRNSQAFQLVQQFGLTDRTIGVLTMADRAGDATNPRGPFDELMAKLDGTANDLVALEPHGYVAVVSRDTRVEQSQQLPLATFKAHELAWFEETLGGYVDRGLASSGVLAVKVERMLVRHVKEQWVPRTLAQLDKLAERVDEQLAYLSQPPETVVQELLDKDVNGQLALVKKVFDASVMQAVLECVDGVVVSLARTLHDKMEAKRHHQERRLLLHDTGVCMDSVVEKMMRRDASSELLNEFTAATVMSAFLRLSLLVCEALPQTNKTYGLAVDRFDNLYLLATASLWEKTRALLADQAQLSKQMVQAMELAQLAPKETTPLAAAFDVDRMLDVEVAVDQVMRMLYTEHKIKVDDVVPLPLEDVFVPTVASATARARVAERHKSGEFRFASFDSAVVGSCAVSTSIFHGMSASEIRNLLIHAAGCEELECTSDQCAQVQRLQRHACDVVDVGACADCNLLLALTRHHVHVCEHWPGATKATVASCVVCAWHFRLSPAPVAPPAQCDMSSLPGSSPSFTIGAAPDASDNAPSRVRHAPMSKLHPTKATATIKPSAPPQAAAKPAPKPRPTSGRSRPDWTTKAPQTGGAPRFGHRWYRHNPGQYAAPDSQEDELRVLISVVGRFVVAPLMRQLVDTHALGRHAMDYLKVHPHVTDDPAHWFYENCVDERRGLLDKKRRVQTARDGLRDFT